MHIDTCMHIDTLTHACTCGHPGMHIEHAQAKICASKACHRFSSPINNGTAHPFAQATKVRRYWAGKAPDWGAHEQQQLQDLQLGGPEARGEAVRTEVAAPVVVQRKADPRLARLAASRNEDVEEVRNRHREIRTAEIVRRRVEEEDHEEEGQQQQDSEEEGEDDVGAGDQQHARRHAASAAAEEEDEGEAAKRRQAVRER